MCLRGRVAAALEDETTEEVTGETNGGLEVLCEAAAEAAMPGRVLVLRPGLIVGPYDPSDRFTWWRSRIARGGKVLAPAPPDGTIEFTDVRDLADFLVLAAGKNVTGSLNASGPTPEKTTFEAFFSACREVSGSDASFEWRDEAFLEAAGVSPWTDLPLYVGAGMAGFSTRDTTKAVAAGLRFRPMQETIRGTLSWASTLPESHEWRAGLSPDREQAALG